MLVDDLGDHLILHGIIHEADHITGRSVVRFLLKSMGIYKVTLFESQLLRLSIHLIDERFNVVFVALVGIFECLMDHFIDVTLFV